MKRAALAGTFALIAGAVSLLLLASILFSCGHGGDPHTTPYNSQSETHRPNQEVTAMTVEAVPQRTDASSPARLRIHTVS